jgi:hypothetical protein
MPDDDRNPFAVSDAKLGYTRDSEQGQDSTGHGVFLGI